MMAQQSTIVGVFDDRLQADRAVDEFRRAGFRDDQIGVAMRYDAGSATMGDAADVADADDTHAGTGAVTGVVAGLGLGALFSHMGKDASEEFEMLHDDEVIPKYAAGIVIGRVKGQEITLEY